MLISWKILGTYYINDPKFPTLTFSLPVLRWAGANTGLPLNSDISKMVRVNIACNRTFVKEY